MRIIAGSLKRREILVPAGRVVRPTTDRTREALFHLVEHRIDLEDCDVLDLFAGSGSLAFEALSRGARSAVLVERDRSALRTLRENARRLGLDDACVVVQSDVGSWLGRFGGRGFDLILADPPYDFPDLAALPARALRLLSPGGLFVLEHDQGTSFESSAGFVLSRSYGRTTLTLFETAAGDEVG